MKYFSPSYWLKLWVLSAPLFNDKTQGIKAMSIDNNIKDWTSENTTGISSVLKNQELNFNNSTEFINHQTHLDIEPWGNNLNSVSTHKHRHEKSRNRHKRQQNQQLYKIKNNHYNEYLYAATNRIAYDSDRRRVFTWRGSDWEEYDTNWKLERQQNQQLYKIKNNHYNEYLYAATNGIAYDSERRNVFTWRGSDWEEYDTNWKLEKHNGDDCLFKIKNNHYNEYLYAATNGFAYNSDRRRVFTWRPETWDSDCIWKIENNAGLFNIKRDFPDYNKNEIYLGVINDILSKHNMEYDIKNAIKQKYPSLQINGIKIVKISDYSHFTAGYSAKIQISNINEICFYDSYGKLKNKFHYITKNKLHGINRIIANDPKFKRWISDINDWNSTLPQAIANAKTFTPQALYNWKLQEKENLKTYIRDWSYVSTLIEYDFKLNELDKNVQGLKSSFNEIKNKINDLENKVSNLENKVSHLENDWHWTCANLVSIPALGVSFIPEIGNIAAAGMRLVAGACAIAGI